MTKKRSCRITASMKRRMPALIALCLVILACEDEYTRENLCDPISYSSIQKKINKAEEGDTILVDPGTYVGNIDFKGKDIVVASLFLTTGDTSYISQTILDGNQKGSVVRFRNGESSRALLSGFTITNGSADYGGGINCVQSSPRLENLKVIGNTSEICSAGDFDLGGQGGGIYIGYQANPSISNVLLRGNWAEGGGGISLYNSSPTLENVIINGNSAGGAWDGYGGGILCSGNSNPSLANVTLSGNTAIYEGGEIYLSNSGLSLMNSIIWNDTPQENYFSGYSDPYSISVSYSNVQGGSAGIVTNNNGTIEWLEGNIDEDPLFVDAENGDFHLQDGSPCIDAGNPDPDYNDPDGSRNDMGAYGGPEGDW